MKGEATIERLLADGELQTVTGAQADGQPGITRALRTCASATEPTMATDRLMPSDAETAVVITNKLIEATERLLPHLGLF